MTDLDGFDSRDRAVYDPQTETYHVQFEWADRKSASQAVEVVAGTEPASMESLYNVIAPDALDALFRPVSEDAPRREGTASFTFDGYDVAVHAHGEIVIAMSNRVGSPERGTA